MKKLLEMKLVTKLMYAALLFICCVFLSCDNPIITDILPDTTKTLSGSVMITGNNWIGETLTADTSFLGGSGTISYQWRSGGADVGTGSAGYVIAAGDVGENITVTVSRSANKGTITSSAVTVQYSITIDMRDAVVGDSLTAAQDTGNAGDTITLNYTVVNSSFYNELVFSGINSAVISGVSSDGSGTKTYVIDSSDASNGVINIIATFTHTNLIPDNITFTDTAGLITVNYGDAFTNAVTNAHYGSGAVSYSSSDTDVAVVNDSGIVTILKAGTTVISAEKIADLVYAHASKSYTLAVAPRIITVTPDTGQGKVFGADDPVFAYTVSEPLIAGDNFGGALSRIPGENAQTYAFTLGTLSAGNNYTLVLGGTESFGITRADGAAVGGAPTVFGVSAPGSITVNAVTIPANIGDQTAEYAISTADDGTGFSAWQAGVIFSCLVAGTDYYVYARSAGNANYNAGDYSVSAAIRFYIMQFSGNNATGGTVPPVAVLPGTVITLPAKGNLSKTGFSFGCWNTLSGGTGDNYAPGQTYTVTENSTLYAKWVAEQTFPFPFSLPVSSTPSASGITISQSGTGTYPRTATIEITNSGEYDSIEWMYGAFVLGTNWELELDAAEILYNAEGTHNLTVMVWKDGVPYSRVVSFVVVL